MSNRKRSTSPRVQSDLRALIEVSALVGAFFKDPKKTYAWIRTANPMLGNASPLMMILLGRAKRLRRFVEQALERQSTREPASRRRTTRLAPSLAELDRRTAELDLGAVRPIPWPTVRARLRGLSRSRARRLRSSRT